MKSISLAQFSYFLFFLTCSPLFGFDCQNRKQECPDRKCSEYLNYKKIKKLFKKECASDEKSCPIRVICYHNGLWWVCPNPRDTKRCENIKESYNKGYFIDYEYIPVSKKAFCDDNNWNS